MGAFWIVFVFPLVVAVGLLFSFQGKKRREDKQKMTAEFKSAARTNSDYGFHHASPIGKNPLLIRMPKIAE